MLITLQQHVAGFASVLVSPSLEEKESFVKNIKKSSKISPQLAIDIYRNNTHGSRINALKSVYPACKNILGDDVFHSLAKAFVDTDIIGSADLNNYGEEFHQHLHSILEVGRLPVEYSYLPDLARLEFLVHAAYYADDDAAFDFELFEERVHKGQKIYFRISASLALLAFQTPVHEIWMNNCKGASNSGDQVVEALTKTQYLLVHREKNTPIVQEINACEYQLLYAFINNDSLQFAIDSIECNFDEILPKLIARRWISSVR